MISDGEKVQVFEVDGKAVKVFKDPNEPKSVVLYEALTHTRVEETGYKRIPALEEVAKIDGKWAISYDYITGDTMADLLKKNPDKAREVVDAVVLGMDRYNLGIRFFRETREKMLDALEQ